MQSMIASSSTAVWSALVVAAAVGAFQGLLSAAKLVGLLAACALTCQLKHQHWRRNAREPPLFGGLIPYFGHCFAFAANHSELLKRLSAASGDAPAFTVYIAGQRMTFVRSALHFRDVLRERRRLQFLPVANQVMSDAFGLRSVPSWEDSTLAHDWNKQSPPQWAMLRGEPLKVTMAKTLGRLQSALLRQEQEQEQDSMAAAQAAEAVGWVDGVDLMTLVREVVWEATASSLYGGLLGAGGTPRKQNMDAFSTFDQHFPALLGGVPASLLPGCTAAMARLRACFSGADGTSGMSDVVQFRQQWLQEADKTPGKTFLGAYQLAFVWATMANTIPTAFWALFWTLHCPEARRACTAEADEVLGPLLADAGGRELGADEVARALTRLPCIDAVLSEALRLCIGSITVRRAMEAFDLKLGDSTDGGDAVAVREGDQVVLAPVLTHFDPEVYDEAQQFRWDRFLLSAADNATDSGTDGSSSPSLSAARVAPRRRKAGKTIPTDVALQPFGGGVSMCPGRHLAWAEVKAFVALVLFRWDIVLQDGSAVPKLDQQRAGLGSLPPAEAVKCRWRLRKHA